MPLVVSAVVVVRVVREREEEGVVMVGAKSGEEKMFGGTPRVKLEVVTDLGAEVDCGGAPDAPNGKQ